MSGAAAVTVALGGLALVALAVSGDDAPAGALAGPYGLAVLAAARRSLGVKETAPNNGPEIAAWAAEVGLTPPLQWCGVAVSHWLREASKATGLPLVVPGAGRAKAILAQFKARGRALTAAEARARALPPGTVLFWDRAKVAGGPEGHTEIVEADHGAAGWTAISGNTESNDVARVQRAREDARLLGAGLVDAAGQKAPPGPAPSPQPPKPTPGPTPRPGPTPQPGPAGGTSPRVLLGGDSLARGLHYWLGQELARTVLGFGANGTTVGQWASALGPLAPLLASLSPGDLVLLCLGTNDIAAGRDPRTVGEDARQILAFVQAAGARAAWIAPPALPQYEQQYPTRNQLEKACEAQGAPLFDSELFEFERASDGIHATPEGYAQWARFIAAWLRERRLV